MNQPSLEIKAGDYIIITGAVERDFQEIFRTGRTRYIRRAFDIYFGMLGKVAGFKNIGQNGTMKGKLEAEFSNESAPRTEKIFSLVFTDDLDKFSSEYYQPIRDDSEIINFFDELAEKQSLSEFLKIKALRNYEKLKNFHQEKNRKYYTGFRIPRVVKEEIIMDL